MSRTLRIVSVAILGTFLVACVPQTPTPPPGWERVKSSSFEIWLPESYEVWDITSENLDAIIEELSSRGPEFVGYIPFILQKPDVLKMIAAFPQISGNLSIQSMDSGEGWTIDEVVETLEFYLQTSGKILERELFKHNGCDAARLVHEFVEFGILEKQVMHLIKEESTLWTVSFTTSAEEFQQLLPEFEQSFKSFRLNRGCTGPTDDA